MDPQIRNKIPLEYQEAFQLGLQGDNSAARNIVFQLLSDKLSLFGLAWSFAIFCPLGTSRWLARASKILDDHRHVHNKSLEQEVLGLMESYMQSRSLASMFLLEASPISTLIKFLQNLEELIKKNIDDEKSVWIRLIKLLFILEVTDLGEIEWQEENLEDLIDELIKYDPKNEYYCYLKELVEPNDDFESALKLNPKLALAYQQQAKRAKEIYDDDTAITFLDKAIAICPRFADAHLAKAETLQTLDKYDDDIMKHINIAIELDPENAEYYYKKGYWLVDLEKYEVAIQCFHKTLELEPFYGAAYNNIAYIHIQRKQFEEAIRAYLSAAKTGLEVKENLRNIARALNDIKQYRKDDTNIREEVIRDVKSLPVSSSIIGSAIASFLSKQNLHQEALEVLRKIPNPSIGAQLGIGQQLKQLGSYQESIQQFQTIADGTEDPLIKSEAFTAIGWIHVNKLQNKKTGLEYIVKSMELDPGYPRDVLLSVSDTTDPSSDSVFIKLASRD
jgi:tetratricopeptide (TPR) repeat protein